MDALLNNARANLFVAHCHSRQHAFQLLEVANVCSTIITAAITALGELQVGFSIPQVSASVQMQVFVG